MAEEKWCIGCSSADFENATTVSGVYRHSFDGPKGLVKINVATLPVCLRAQFLAFLHTDESEFPDRSIAVHHYQRGHGSAVIASDYLGACAVGETCNGRNQ